MSVSKKLLLFTSLYFIAMSAWCETDLDGLIISEITIQAQNIFDLKDERENGLPYKAANSLHIVTRESTIRQHLLFKEGDTFSQRLLEESERLLRKDRYISEAAIVAEKKNDTVHLIVTTTDTWSTKPKIVLSRTGGSNKSELGIQEENLLGKGIKLGLSYSNNIDRSSSTLHYYDKFAFKDNHALDLQFSNNSDGYIKGLSIIKPFYAFDTQKSSGFSFRSEKREDKLYFRSEKYQTFDNEEENLHTFIGRSSYLNDNTVVRQTVGIEHTSNTYTNGVLQLPNDISLPDSFINSLQLQPNDKNTTLSYYKIDYLENSYKKLRNFERIDRIEDRNTGLNMGLTLGYSSKSLYSDTSYWLIDSYLNKHIQLSESEILLVNLSSTMEINDNKVNNLLALYSLSYHHAFTDQLKFFSQLNGSYSHNLDWEKQNFINGENGLRGYPENYLSAPNTQSLTVEQRYFSNYNPFRIFNLGAAVFFDISKAQGGNALEKHNNGTYRNVGFGLRISNNRTAIGDMIHIDFSFPLDIDASNDKFQIQIESKTTF